MKETSLNGLVIAITGAGRGIGLATARTLSKAGARVALGDIDAALAKEEAERIGAKAIGLEVDISNEDSFASFIGSVESQLGPVDVLINNAGIMPIGPFLDEPHSLARRALDINVSGALIGMKTVLPGFVARGSGHVVNVASVAGKSPVPGGLTYAATKAAVVSMTESARVEFASSGVQFTCVMPSFTNTELIAGTKGTKLIRTVEPDEVGQAIQRAIEKPRPDVYVPRVLAPIVWTQPLLGRSLRDRLNHLLGADRAFLDVDGEARRKYDDRITPTTERGSAKSRRR